MKNFTIILFTFFLIFLTLSLFATDSLLFFLLIFVSFLIGLICLTKYLGLARGLICGLAMIILPFLLEYLFRLMDLPYFQTSLVESINANQIKVPLTITNLFTVFTLPLLLICALFFAQKMKLFFNIKKRLNLFITLLTSILFAINFFIISQDGLAYINFLKLLVLALLINLFIHKLYVFRIDASDIFKDLPIIIFLAIYCANAIKLEQTNNLIIAAFLTALYLLLLYNEYKFKKISQHSLT